MSISALIGIGLLLVSISLFVYQIMIAFMNMGVSDKFNYENICLADLVDPSTLERVDGISSIYVQSVAETLLTMPLAILLFAGAIVFFFLHAFTSERRIRKG